MFRRLNGYDMKLALKNDNKLFFCSAHTDGWIFLTGFSVLFYFFPFFLFPEDKERNRFLLKLHKVKCT